ncbi:hypothetical protein KHA80_05700 [Anaerobacillus sp. HL2]|nr:hypothetical protein KHA80_05700 [Anaerobacillus sp. HL2]
MKNMLEKISEKAMVKAVNVEVLLVLMEQLEQLAKRSFTTITCLEIPLSI